jgi:hypothetical protein
MMVNRRNFNKMLACGVAGSLASPVARASAVTGRTVLCNSIGDTLDYTKDNALWMGLIGL